MQTNNFSVSLFSEDDLLHKLRLKEIGPWMKVVIDCVDRDISDGMIKKDRNDALQAAYDYYQRLSIWVNSKFELLPYADRNEEKLTGLWDDLQKTDPRKEISIKKV